MDSNKHQHPIEDIHLRSEEVQEILTRPPRRIVRVGITLILLVVLTLFVGSYYIKYPDIVPATITCRLLDKFINPIKAVIKK